MVLHLCQANSRSVSGLQENSMRDCSNSFRKLALSKFLKDLQYMYLVFLKFGLEVNTV